MRIWLGFTLTSDNHCALGLSNLGAPRDLNPPQGPVAQRMAVARFTTGGELLVLSLYTHVSSVRVHLCPAGAVLITLQSSLRRSTARCTLHLNLHFALAMLLCGGTSLCIRFTMKWRVVRVREFSTA